VTPPGVGGGRAALVAILLPMNRPHACPRMTATPAKPVAFDLTAWGWIHLLLGALVACRR
jgi:hypothetical protein